MTRTALLLFAIALSASCGDSEPEASTTPEPVAPSLPEVTTPPDHLIWELSVPNALFGDLANSLPPTFRMLFRSSPAEAIEMATQVRAARLVVPASNIVAIGASETLETTVAVTVSADAVRTQVQAAGLRPGPFGGQWVTLSEEWKALLVEDILLLGTDEAALEAATPYVVHRLRGLDAAEHTATVDFTEHGVGKLRELVREIAENQAAELRSQAEEERERHESEPDLGEPEALVAWAEPKVREVLELLDGVSTAQLEVSFQERVRITLNGSVTEGSTLSSTLGEMRGFSMDPEALPLLFAAVRRDGPEEELWLDQLLADVAQERVPEAERAKLRELAEAIQAARFAEEARPAEGVLAGTCTGGAFALWSTETSSEVDVNLARIPLASTHLRHVLSRTAGCEDEPRRARPADQVSLCDETFLFVESTESRLTYGGFRGDESDCRAKATEAVTALAAQALAPGDLLGQSSVSLGEAMNLFRPGLAGGQHRLQLSLERHENTVELELGTSTAGFQQILSVVGPLMMR